MHCGPFYYYGFTLIAETINNDINYKVFDEITYSFPNLSSATVEIWDTL